MSGAVITGPVWGALIEQSGGSVDNEGTIASSGNGVELSRGGAVSNGLTGFIAGDSLGIAIGSDTATTTQTGTVTNLGTVSGGSGTSTGYAAVLLADGGILANGQSGSGVGLITAANRGVIIGRTTGGTGTVTNFGSIVGQNGGILFYAGGTVTNSGTIVGGILGIEFRNVAGTIINSGSILAYNGGGVLLDNGGVVINQAGGRIQGQGNAYSSVQIEGSSGSVDNAGYVLGTGLEAVVMHAGGVVTNQAGGTIVGNSAAIRFQYQPGTVINAGTIRSLGAQGVDMFAGGTVVNQAGGVISSDNPDIFGIFIGFAPGYVTNAGYVKGIVLRDNGSIANEIGGTIGGFGITTVLAPITVTNAGFIGGYGVNLAAGGSVTNVTGGTIVGTSGTAFASYAGVFIGGGAGTVSNAGTIIGADSGIAVRFDGTYANRVIVNSGAVFGGGLTGGGGTDTLELAGSAGAPVVADYDALGLTGFEQVLFGSGNYATLKVSNNSGTLPVTISGFDATTETIDLTGIGTNGQVTSNDTVNHRVTITGSLGGVTLQLDASDGTMFATGPDGGGGTNFTIACFCRGTLIRTPSGDVPVEALAIDNEVLTLSGRARRIKWIGRRAYDPRFIRGNSHNMLPVRVTVGALGAGVPARDLCLSPEHALYVDGLFLPARHLVNGVTIRQAEWHDNIEYFHIELDSHDVIFAEGVAAESFVAFGGRGMFHNGVEFVALYPHDEPPDWEAYEALLARGKAGLPRIRARLLAHAERLGLISRDPDLHLVVDGKVVRPLSIDGGIHRFAVPAGSGEVRIVSRSVVPVEIAVSSPDRRRLGVPVRRIALYGAGRRIEIRPDCPGLRDGFHADEGSHRWTDGHALLPWKLLASAAGDLTIEVQIAATGLSYPINPPVANATSQRTHKPRHRRAAG